MTGPIDVEIGTAAQFQDIVDAIPRAPRLAPALSALALAEVSRGVMTGEGPTTRGRIHFSRTIDAQDAAMCERILIAADGAESSPVSREEIEILFDINESAREREDGGRFDDLLIKAVAHHVVAAAGRPVPSRAVALSASISLSDWASPADFAAVDREIAAWLAARVRGKRRMGTALETLAVLLIGAGALPAAMSIAAVLDLAA